ncbi:retrovirus-related pol polyprotein from transposon TNT 1-94 [Tanacetum coccineum]
MHEMSLELQALEANKTWTITSLPPGKIPIGHKWVYRIKCKADGTLDKYKERLVAKGFTQKEGIDYYDTFALVAKMVTIRAMLAIAINNNWYIAQLDVNNVFLHGDLTEESQRKYALKLIQSVGFLNVKPSNTLFNPLTKLRPEDAQALSQFLQAPRTTHLKALVKVLRRSVTGYCIFLGLCLLSWQSKKKNVVSRSFTEAEYRAVADTTYELTWLKYLLKDLGVHISSLIPIFYDNASAITLVSNPVQHARTKHIESWISFRSSVILTPPSFGCLEGSNDKIDKLLDDGNDAEPEHPAERDDDILAENIAKDVSEKLREDYRAATSNIGEKSLDSGRFRVRDQFANSSPAMRYVISLDDSHHLGSRSKVNSFARSPVTDAPVMTVAVTTSIVADVFVVLVSKGRVKSGNLENFGDSVSVGGANMNVANSSKLNEPATSSDSFYASQDLDSETLYRIYVPKWKVTNDSILDDPYVCRDLMDRLAPLALFSQLLRMRAEHTLEQNDKLEVKCAEQAALLLEKDAEIADLKSLLSLKEAEAAEAIRLHGQLSVMEAAYAVKGNELKGLKEKNLALEEEKNVLSEKVTTLESVTAAKETKLASLSAQVAKLTSNLSGFQLSRDELSSKVASLESERDSLADQRSLLESAFELFKGRMEDMQDEKETVLGNQVAELDAQLLKMTAHLEEEFYPRFLTTLSGWQWILTHGIKLVLLNCLQSSEYLHTLEETIGYAINKGMQDGLKAWIDYRKAGRDLSVIEAYDPSAEAKYVDVMNALCIVDFSLLSLLKSKKDACMVDLMDSLRLEGPLAEIPRAEELQPSLEQLMLPIHRAKDDVEEITEKRLLLTDAMIPLAEPLSSKSLIGEAGTSAIPATTEPITTLSTTVASSGVVPPLFLSNYQVSDAEPHDEDPPAITFEEEELDTTPESAVVS